jgi:hypothetical protein
MPLKEPFDQEINFEMQYTEEDKKSIEAFIILQLGKNSDSLTTERKISLLNGKFKRMLLLMVVNFGILLFFGYSFYYEITELSRTVYYLIIIFFALNVYFLGLQWKKLRGAVNWLETQKK